MLRIPDRPTKPIASGVKLMRTNTDRTAIKLRARPATSENKNNSKGKVVSDIKLEKANLLTMPILALTLSIRNVQRKPGAIRIMGNMIKAKTASPSHIE